MASWQVGDALPPLVKPVPLAQLVAYGGPGSNFHSDPEVARGAGYPNVVAWGMLTVAFVSELMGSHFGLGWARGGRLAVNLVKPLFADDTVSVCGQVTAVEPEGEAIRVTFDVWCANEQGDKVLVGTASALVPAPDGVERERTGAHPSWRSRL